MRLSKENIFGLVFLGLMFLLVLVSGICHLCKERQGMSKAEICRLAELYGAKHNLEPSLVKAIIWKESRFRVKTRGAAGEIGLMQLHRPAVKEWSNRMKRTMPTEEQLFNPEVNIDIGCWYLAWTGSHWKNYKSALVLQISEYNAGYGNVTKGWLPKDPAKEVRLKDITISSTQKYVEVVLTKKREYDKK